jgi:hypothetical protein
MNEPSNHSAVNRAAIFLSCAQRRDSEETALANAIKNRLEAPGFDFDCWVALEEQSPLGLREVIFNKIAEADYFVFVDFRRDRLGAEPGALFRGSLFCHQELAIASFLEIPLLVFQEDGREPLDGMLGIIPGNSHRFYTRQSLPDFVNQEVKNKLDTGAWSNTTRNQLELLLPETPHEDHAVRLSDGTDRLCRYFHVCVRNLHHVKAACQCFAYLEAITNVKTGQKSILRTVEFKWSGTFLPGVRIAPKSYRFFDAFCVLHNAPTQIQFNPLTDSVHYIPVIPGPGDYDLTYAVTPENFPTARRFFRLSIANGLQDIKFAAL